jgi:hypothetical protein
METKSNIQEARYERAEFAGNDSAPSVTATIEGRMVTEAITEDYKTGG